MTTIRLSRPSSNASWGFRIHGGKDFNQPLIILKTNPGSAAEQSGLSSGDAILRINNVDALELRHKQAQDLILNSGNNVELVVQKGATNTWMPKVTPLGELNSQQKVFTKTSLKKTGGGQGYTPASGINSIARPYTHIVKDGRSLVNSQFNSPINMYSEQNIKETLSAQAEVLAGGAIGVDFKKNEKPYKYEDSEVYKMLKEVESQPEPAGGSGNEENRNIQIPIANYAPPQQSPTLLNHQSLLKSVKAPETKPEGTGGNVGTNPNLCSECERLIVGVFVRIKDKNLHVECFKCATCGQSLKNIGYFNINNKLYCDVHAKSFAKAHPPGPGLEPYTTIPVPKHIFSVDSQGNEVLQDDWKSATLQNGQSIYEETASNQFTSATQAGKTTTVPINVKPYSYIKQPSVPDGYASNVAPMPYHHSPTQAHHVTAPKSPIKTPSQPLFPSSIGGTKSSSQTYETKSSSFSETITKSGGSKFVWPPAHKPGDEDQVMMMGSGGVSSVAPPSSDLITIPIQHESSSYSSNTYSSFGTGGGLEQTLQSSSASSSGFGGLSNTFSSVPAPSFGSATSPLNTYNSPTPGYKPVAPPKPSGFKQQQMPYKPVSNLLTTANKAPAMPSPPMLSPKIAPPFGGPSNFAGPGSLLAGAPITARGKGQFGRGIMPTRGKGILTQPGPRIAICGVCQKQIRGPFITATAGKIYCPEHFKCNTPNCKRPLIDIGFVEERGALYCEYCWESYLAPECGKCRRRIKNECLNAIGQHFHPTCFACSNCGAVFGNSAFYLEDGRPYCEKDWNEMFTTKCFACGFPIEAGDRWVEAMTNNYHSQCFNCSACKKNLEGQSFFAKGGRPFCKQHAR